MRQELFEFCNPKVIGETWFTNFFRPLFVGIVHTVIDYEIDFGFTFD